ncbi:dihydrofolate reductase family protein [Saprospiraceae bacterium]|jgi:dihydrofolate reductase|nr:dihydrofolate reductase family protein [Bacteroidota bacterium]MDB4727636.1 dihydrofolate reductase family protein [Saprospiraceae bacterium]MDF1868654.1 dihydrofolate reductase family protein [Saprospiraceae bacterium]
MRKVVLYSACSIDNYIARKDGAIDWLFSDSHYGYFEFLATIDTTLMGNKTYQQILSFDGEFPYKDLNNFAFTRKKDQKDTDYVKIISKDIEGFVKELKAQKGKTIWLIGGGEINSILLEAGLIDEMVLSIHPIILGEGIPLFAGNPSQSDFILSECKTFPSGLVQLFLQKKLKE